jgi:hypothetical protein
MTEIDFFTGYILLMGIVAGSGLLYLLYAEQYAVEYDPFFVITMSGLFLFIIGGPLSEVVYPNLVHWIHGLAACLVLFGLYSPVQNDLRRDQWTKLLLAEPSQIRASTEWMVPMDDAILSLFHSSDLVLTPAIIAYNIDHSREEVNRRLRKLEEADLVEKVDRGKYRMTPNGEAYLSGEFNPTLS